MSWPTVSFTEVLKDVTGGNTKTLQSNYADVGQYPIIDQGQEMIGGYTDDTSCLCQTKPPVIIFGDHTKTLKFIDFPFCLGADGTKVLEAKDGADPKYLFYALHDIHIPEAGYSRHFKYLKAGRIPLPPLEEQKRIAGILDQADALRRLRTRALEKLNTLGQAIFHEMFGDPKIEPNRWPVLNFNDACKDETAKSPKVQKVDYCDSGEIPVIDQGQKATAGYTDQENVCQSVSPVIIFGDHTRAVKYIDFPFAIGADGAKVLKPSKHYAPLFFAALLKTLPVPDLGYSRHMREVKKLRFPLPPLELQIAFSKKISSLTDQKITAAISLGRQESLFASLQHRAFRGEL
jgi:type I restriction enzyme S subunit